MGYLNIIIAVGGGGKEGWELERTNLQKFKHQVEGGRSGRKGVAREGSGSSDGRGPRERGDPRGRGVPWGKVEASN